MEISSNNILIDIGGTYIRIGIDKEYESPFIVMETPKSKEALLKTLEMQINKVFVDNSMNDARIFISCPGLIDKSGMIIKSFYVPLTGVNLSKEIKQKTGKDVLVINDSNIQALGCYKNDSLLYMNIGTAIGGAYVFDNQILCGSNGFACEFGHIFIGTKNKCTCGRVGCLDTVASGQCFISKFGDRWWEKKNNYYIQKQIKVAGIAVGNALAQMSILFNPKEICVTGRICEDSLFQNFMFEEFHEKSWYNIPIVLKNNSWENVYQGFNKIIKGECNII